MKNLMTVLLFACALTSLASACGDAPDSDKENNGASGCEADSDCKGDRVCDAGACVDPSGGNGGGGNGGGGNGGGGNGGGRGNGGGGNTGGGNGGGNTGAIGAACDDDDVCDSQYCRVPPGAFDGSCAVNDFGEMCSGNQDCAYGACLFRDGDDFGYCTATCEGFTDCPSFWNCEEVGNAAGTYCQQ